MTAPRSDALVFFGATGDLAYKKIFPALQALIRRGHLDMPVIGVAKSGWNLDQLKARAKDSLEKHGGLDPAAYAKLCSLLGYVEGDYGDPTTFAKLRQGPWRRQRPLYYLAIPPSLFATVAEGLAKSGCVKNARVVVEKPFGRDLASARELNRTLHRYFPEQAIFRIDHYLGKEPVQNLIYFRFANPLIEAGWNNQHIESVQITMAESFGVAGRGKFYEEAGAIRDVVQNHMLEVIACLAMECPAGKDHEARRDERGRLLKAVRTLDPSDVVRGQFRGYRREPGVAPDSQVETFAALRFHIDNERWNGVPFYVRVGKCLPVTATEVLVRFKRPPRPVLDETGAALGQLLSLPPKPRDGDRAGYQGQEAGGAHGGGTNRAGRPPPAAGRDGALRAAPGRRRQRRRRRSSRARTLSRRPGASWTRSSGKATPPLRVRARHLGTVRGHADRHNRGWLA